MPGVITQNVTICIKLPASATNWWSSYGNAASRLNCHQRYDLTELKQQYEQTGNVAPCPLCRGLIKTATISFGQSMPEKEMQRAAEMTAACDDDRTRLSLPFILRGFPEHVAQRGASLQ